MCAPFLSCSLQEKAWYSAFSPAAPGQKTSSATYNAVSSCQDPEWPRSPTMVAADTGADIYNEALRRRKDLMGASGPAALLKNFRVFSIAAFACIGGVLYGYNQGMFSGLLTMPAFESRKYFQSVPLMCHEPC